MDNLIVWCGRFQSKTGYGKATRDYFYSLRSFLEKNQEWELVGLDSTNNTLVLNSDICKVSKKEEGTIEVDFSEDVKNVYFVCNETANYFDNISLSGRVRFIGLTMHEFLDQAKNQKDQLSLPDELWMPSSWNKKLLVDNMNFDDSFIKVVPCVYNELEEDKNVVAYDRLKIDKEIISFLFIVSNVERKNASRVLLAFITAFDGYEDVQLIVKLPGGISRDEFETKIVPPPSLFSIKKKIPSVLMIRDSLTDSEMKYLHQISDVNINAETSKGFDLDSMLSLVNNKQVIATYVGGFTEYADLDQIYEIKRSEISMFNKNEYTNIDAYGEILDRAPGINDIKNAFLEFYDDQKKSIFRNTKELAENVREKLSGTSISAKLLGFLESHSEDHDFRSLLSPKIVINKKNPYRGLSFPFSEMTKSENQKLNRELKELDPSEKMDDLISKRRQLFGSYGTLPPCESDISRLAEIRGKYSGERCFVVGNGPSLNKTDLSKLKNEYTFCSNKFYLKLKDIDWLPTFYTCLDWRVTPDDSVTLNNFFTSNSQITKFLPNRFRGVFEDRDDIYWYESISAGKYLKEKFEADLKRPVRGGGTVSTAMIQIAAYMGFKDIYLIGTDVTYVIPKSVVQEGRDRFKTGVKINLTSTLDDDPNHFAPNYFGAGARWHDPNVAEMKRGFRSCYLAGKMMGVNIWNATVGGALDCVPRVDYDKLF